MESSEERHPDPGLSASGAVSPPAREQGARRRPGREEPGPTLLSPAIVPMTEEQHRRAVSALAELLLWAMDGSREHRQAA